MHGTLLRAAARNAPQLLIVCARFEHFSVRFLRNSLQCDPGDDDVDGKIDQQKLYKFISWQLTGITLTKFINLLRIGYDGTPDPMGAHLRFCIFSCLINEVESGNGEKLAIGSKGFRVGKAFMLGAVCIREIWFRCQRCRSVLSLLWKRYRR